MLGSISREDIEELFPFSLSTTELSLKAPVGKSLLDLVDEISYHGHYCYYAGRFYFKSQEDLDLVRLVLS